MFEWLLELYTAIGFYFIAAFCLVVEFYVDRICRYGGLSRLKYLHKSIKESKFVSSASDRKLIAFVTGADGTIGTEITRLLLQNNFKIICVLRNRRNIAWMDEFADHPDVVVRVLDLADLPEVKKTAKLLSTEHPSIDLIICNAAVMLHPFELTGGGCNGGFETHFAINLLSHAILVHHLLHSSGVEKSSGEVGAEKSIISERRIVFLSSATAHLGDFCRIPVGNPKFFSSYLNGYYAYSTSKLAISLYAEELNNRLQCERPEERMTTVISLHPGCIPGALYQNANFWSKLLIHKFLYLLMRNAAMAAAEVVALGCANNLKGGCYYQHMIPTKFLCTTTYQQKEQLYQRVQNVIKSI